MKFAAFVGAALLWAALSAPAQTVQVAAAANLAVLEKPLREAFARSGTFEVAFTFSSSGALVTQITQGAPVQVFLSADMASAQKLVDLGLAVGPVQPYALGKLIFLSTRPLPNKKDLTVLLDPKIVHFATSNPQTAPYGKAVQEALMRSGLFEAVGSKQVTAQSVAQALQLTLTATNFGFVSQSALKSPEVAAYREEGKYWFAVDPALYTPIQQGFVVVKSAQKDQAAAAFAAFLVSPAARAVLAEYGYALP